MRYVDLEGDISISSKRVFLSHARHDEVARRLLSDLLEDLREDVNEPWNTQFRKSWRVQFKDASTPTVNDRGDLDPEQVLNALFAAGWRYVQTLNDEEHNAIDPSKIAALMEVCDPDYVLTGERENDNEDPSIDH